MYCSCDPISSEQMNNTCWNISCYYLYPIFKIYIKVWPEIVLINSHNLVKETLKEGFVPMLHFSFTL